MNENNISWKTLFLKNSGGFSSKRFSGILGWIVCLIIYIVGFAIQKDIPEYGELLAILSSSLLGLDSITGMWQKSVNKS